MKNFWIFVFTLLFSWGVSAEDALDVANAAYKRKDFDAALEILQPLANDGVPSAQYGYGLLLVNGEGIPKDPSRGWTFITLAAEAGFAKAQGALAARQYFETPIPDAYEAAAAWARKAAAQGDIVGQTVLGYA
jgi:TPR repeat protein